MNFLKKVGHVLATPFRDVRDTWKGISKESTPFYIILLAICNVVFLLIANIIADIIIRMFDDVDTKLNPHGVILTSGIIADRIPEVIEKAEQQGFVVDKMNEKAGWAAIIFRRKEDMQ